jgi:hypothetical protein
MGPDGLSRRAGIPQDVERFFHAILRPNGTVKILEAIIEGSMSMHHGSRSDFKGPE